MIVAITDWFRWPAAMPALLLVPVVWLLLRRLDRSRARRLQAAVGPRTSILAGELGERQRRMRRGLMTAGLALALLAVVQPTWGFDLRRVEQRGVDLLVCLDVSRSMLARDLQPNRLRRAQHEIRALAEQTRDDRLGLVVFAGEARLSVPLTRDTKSFAELVDLASPVSVGLGGTDLGAALETALEAFKGDSGDHEAVLLITDGEDLERRGLSVAAACRDRNIVVHCAGFGSALGSKITIETDGSESFLRSRSGDEVVSAMDEAGLRRIAEATGGGFIDVRTSTQPLLDLYDQHVLPMARKTFSAEEQRERKHRFQWPLLVAFVLWFLELCMTDRRRR